MGYAGAWLICAGASAWVVGCGPKGPPPHVTEVPLAEFVPGDDPNARDAGAAGAGSGTSAAEAAPSEGPATTTKGHAAPTPLPADPNASAAPPSGGRQRPRGPEAHGEGVQGAGREVRRAHRSEQGDVDVPGDEERPEAAGGGRPVLHRLPELVPGVQLQVADAVRDAVHEPSTPSRHAFSEPDMRPVATTALAAALPLLLLAGCGSSNAPAKSPDEVTAKNADGGTAASDAATEGSAASVCTGSESRPPQRPHPGRVRGAQRGVPTSSAAT